MARRMHPMEAGERDRLVRLVPLTEGVDTEHFPIEEEGTAISVWASKNDIGARERFTADQMSAPYTTRWELAYRSDIDPDVVDVPKAFRLVYQGRTYDIQAASMIGRKEGVELLTLARNG